MNLPVHSCLSPPKRGEASSSGGPPRGAEPTKTLQARGSSGAARPWPTSQIFLVRAALPTARGGSAHHVSLPPGFLERYQVPLQPERRSRSAREKKGVLPAERRGCSNCLPTGVFFFFPRAIVKRWKIGMLAVIQMLAYRFSTSRLLYSKTKAVPNNLPVLTYPKKTKTACNVILENPRPQPSNPYFLKFLPLSVLGYFIMMYFRDFCFSFSSFLVINKYARFQELLFGLLAIFKYGRLSEVKWCRERF